MTESDFDYAAWAAQPPDMATAMQAAQTEWERRRAAPLIEDAKEAQIAELVEAGALEVADAPTAASMPADPAKRAAWIATIPAFADLGRPVRRGGLVRHSGRIWRSETAGLNVWEPGAPGVHHNVWLDVTAEVMAGIPDPETGQPAPVEDGSREAPFTFRAGIPVQPGQYVTYSGDLYEVVQGHTTQDDWTPPAVPSLYRKV